MARSSRSFLQVAADLGGMLDQLALLDDLEVLERDGGRRPDGRWR